MKHYIELKDEEQSKKIQAILINRGYLWNSSDTFIKIPNIKTEVMCIIIDEKIKRLAYADALWCSKNGYILENFHADGQLEFNFDDV